MLDRIKEILTKEGHISKIDEELSDDIHGIKFHHAGIDGVDENRIVIREYRNGTSGDVLLLVEFKPIDNEWEVQDSNYNTLSTVTGEESYEELAEKIASQLRD